MFLIKLGFLSVLVYIVWFAVDYDYIIHQFTQDAKLISELKNAIGILQFVEFCILAMFNQQFFKDSIGGEK